MHAEDWHSGGGFSGDRLVIQLCRDATSDRRRTRRLLLHQERCHLVGMGRLQCGQECWHPRRREGEHAHGAGRNGGPVRCCRSLSGERPFDRLEERRHGLDLGLQWRGSTRHPRSRGQPLSYPRASQRSFRHQGGRRRRSSLRCPEGRRHRLGLGKQLERPAWRRDQEPQFLGQPGDRTYRHRGYHGGNGAFPCLEEGWHGLGVGLQRRRRARRRNTQGSPRPVQDSGFVGGQSHCGRLASFRCPEGRWHRLGVGRRQANGPVDDAPSPGRFVSSRRDFRRRLVFACPERRWHGLGLGRHCKRRPG
jgi:hypothetical protein